MPEPGIDCGLDGGREWGAEGGREWGADAGIEWGADGGMECVADAGMEWKGRGIWWGWCGVPRGLFKPEPGLLW